MAGRSRRGRGRSTRAASTRNTSRTIHAPVTDFEGTVAGVAFAKGTGETSDPRALAYFRRHGYGIDEPAAPPEGADRPAVEPIVSLGTLRDAAVDPRPEDFLPPVNAGEANPHGPLVVSPEIHGSGTKGIKPGDVHVGEPAEQEADETALAKAVLVEGQPATEAVPAAAEGDVEPAPAPTKKELLARADELGLEMPKRATNAQIAEAIAAAEAGQS